jgi:hypothetical protein
MRRYCTRDDGKCGDQYCGKTKNPPTSCAYEYVETGGPHDYKGDKWPPPRRWVSLDGIHIYRTYSDYVED